MVFPRLFLSYALTTFEAPVSACVELEGEHLIFRRSLSLGRIGATPPTKSPKQMSLRLPELACVVSLCPFVLSSAPIFHADPTSGPITLFELYEKVSVVYVTPCRILTYSSSVPSMSVHHAK